MEESEYALIRDPRRGSCLYKCGNDRYPLAGAGPGVQAGALRNGRWTMNICGIYPAAMMMESDGMNRKTKTICIHVDEERLKELHIRAAQSQKSLQDYVTGSDTQGLVRLSTVLVAAGAKGGAE